MVLCKEAIGFVTLQKECQMSKINIASKYVLPIIIIGLLLGFGAGLILAGREPVVEAQAPLNESEGEGSERPNQSTIFYYRASGISFLPSFSGYEYVHTAKGCLYRPDSNNNGQSDGSDIRLPQGAEITTFNVYFNDNSSLNLDVDLIAYDNAGGETLIRSSGSTAANGYGSVNSGVFSHSVNNIAESLSMIVTIPPNQNNSLQFCGVRMTYEFDMSANYLPAMLNMAAP
jgi:hypothetical protein